MNSKVLAEADVIVDNIKRDAYGPLKESFEGIARIWSGILGYPIKATEVALCMIGLKLSRESARHTRDNLVDIAGYTKCLEVLTDEFPPST